MQGSRGLETMEMTPRPCHPEAAATRKVYEARLCLPTCSRVLVPARLPTRAALQGDQGAGRGAGSGVTVQGTAQWIPHPIHRVYRVHPRVRGHGAMDPTSHI